MENLNIKKISFHKHIIIIISFFIFFIILHFNKNLYIPFVFISETFTIIVSYCIMLISINTFNISENNYYTSLGVNFAFISLFTLIHLFTNETINLLPTSSGEISPLFGIAAEYWQSIAILVSFKYLNKKIEYKKLILKNLFFFIIVSLAIFHIGNSSLNLIYGFTLIEFQTISTCIISVIFIFSIFLIYKYRILGYRMLAHSIVLMIISQLIFFRYTNNYELHNALGHLFKFISFYFIYKALVSETLKNPVRTIFNDLKIKTNELEKINKELNARNKELRDSKKNLRKSSERYKKLLNSLPEAVVLIDKKQICYVNDKALELLNVNTKEEILEKSIFSIINKDFWDKVKERIDIGYTDHSLPPLEEKFFTGDGKTLDVEVTAVGAFIDDKEYYLKIIRDVTNKKRLEEINLKLQENIQHDKIKNEFFANISHELRTPINVIYSALQLEDIYINQNNINKIKDYNNIIKQNCYRLIRLINNIIDITKIDSGFLKANFCFSNIVNVTENIVMSIVPYVKNKNMNIIFDTELEEQYMRCDLDFIERIILNLISNSIKYGKENGTISVNIYNNTNDYINISIKDNGIGIPKEKQKDIFNRFIQVDKTFKRRTEGSGIGLSLVKSLVEIQGGTIVLRSEEGVGTEVIISFPITTIDEVASTSMIEDVSDDNIVEKVSIEFSDIYL